MGLRERKKVKLRQAVRREALRLFAEQGWEATTVGQIADAADISTTTFYRYFTGKEDVVLGGPDEPGESLVPELLAARPAGEPLPDALRAIHPTLAAGLESNRDEVLTRYDLSIRVPDLRARMATEQEKNYAAYTEALTARTGRAAGDYPLRLAVALLLAAHLEAVRHWVENRGEPDLTSLLDQSIAPLTPYLASLQK
ncbi:MAG: TetR/AcrR family transcriptional regulator [Mycobacteriales bacterium]